MQEALNAMSHSCDRLSLVTADRNLLDRRSDADGNQEPKKVCEVGHDVVTLSYAYLSCQ